MSPHISPAIVCEGNNAYVVCRSDQKGNEANSSQEVGWPNSTDESAKSERYKHRREVENGEDSSFPSHMEQT